MWRLRDHDFKLTSYLDFKHSKHMIIKLNPTVWNPTEFHAPYDGLVKFLASHSIQWYFDTIPYWEIPIVVCSFLTHGLLMYQAIIWMWDAYKKKNLEAAQWYNSLMKVFFFFFSCVILHWFYYNFGGSSMILL